MGGGGALTRLVNNKSLCLYNDRDLGFYFQIREVGVYWIVGVN